MAESIEVSESPMPLLLISHGEWFERHLICNISDNQCKLLTIPVLCNKKIYGSSHGWLILVEYYNSDECCLFNPMSMEIITLPPLDNNRLRYNQCILTKSPTEPDCHILFNAGDLLSFCRIGDNGDNRFVHLSCPLGPQPDIDYCSISAIGTFRGHTYGFIKYPYPIFGSIHFLKNNLEFRPIKLTGSASLTPRATLGREIWLIESPQESCGGEVELLMIQKIYLTSNMYINNTGLNFRVFRIDVNEGTYVEVLDLGKRTIFLSGNGGGYCCNSVEGVKPNSIYYLNKSRDTKSNDRSLHIFDLEDGCTTSQLFSDGVGYHSLTSWVHNTNLMSDQFMA